MSRGTLFKNGSAIPLGHEKDNAISTAAGIYRGKYKAFRPDAPQNSLIDPLASLFNVRPRLNGEPTFSLIDDEIILKKKFAAYKLVYMCLHNSEYRRNWYINVDDRNKIKLVTIYTLRITSATFIDEKENSNMIHFRYISEE